VCILHSPSLCCDLMIPPIFVILLPTPLHHFTTSPLHPPLCFIFRSSSRHLPLAVTVSHHAFSSCLSLSPVRRQSSITALLYCTYLHNTRHPSSPAQMSRDPSRSRIHIDGSPIRTSMIPISRHGSMEAWKQASILMPSIHSTIAL
jgi:hypothetical protein